MAPSPPRLSPQVRVRFRHQVLSHPAAPPLRLGTGWYCGVEERDRDLFLSRGGFTLLLVTLKLSARAGSKLARASGFSPNCQCAIA